MACDIVNRDGAVVEQCDVCTRALVGDGYTVRPTGELQTRVDDLERRLHAAVFSRQMLVVNVLAFLDRGMLRDAVRFLEAEAIHQDNALES